VRTQHVRRPGFPFKLPKNLLAAGFRDDAVPVVELDFGGHRLVKFNDWQRRAAGQAKQSERERRAPIGPSKAPVDH
jgi:hypothetical protein